MYAWIEEQRARLEEDLGLDLFLKGELVLDILFQVSLVSIYIIGKLQSLFFPRSTCMKCKHTLISPSQLTMNLRLPRSERVVWWEVRWVRWRNYWVHPMHTSHLTYCSLWWQMLSTTINVPPTSTTASSSVFCSRCKFPSLISPVELIVVVCVQENIMQQAHFPI